MPQRIHTIEKEKKSLRLEIKKSLRKQGFRVLKNKIFPPSKIDKESLRSLHKQAVDHRIEKAKKNLIRYEKSLLNYIASGDEIIPREIEPFLIEVKSDSIHELLFRYVTLHWSIPVSSGYGRRLRFLVLDKSNNKLIGVIGLGDPVFSLAPRDNWIDWDFKTRRERLRYVLEAFVLGSIPPYSMLLCGKLIAMILTSNEVQKTFERKYQRHRTYINGKDLDSRLALLTTSSALGRSSIYNRIRYKTRELFLPVGFTGGWGEFHFANGLYKNIFEFTSKYCKPTAKKKQWGNGFRNRREVVRKCLNELNLSDELMNHGIARQLFVVPLAKNTQSFLRGEHSRLFRYRQSVNELFNFFKDRWLLPRADRDPRFTKFRKRDYGLWNGVK